AGAVPERRKTFAPPQLARLNPDSVDDLDIRPFLLEPSLEGLGLDMTKLIVRTKNHIAPARTPGHVNPHGAAFHEGAWHNRKDVAMTMLEECALNVDLDAFRRLS